MIRRISKVTAERRGTTPSGNLPIERPTPDPGFSGNPGTQKIADQAVREARRQIQQAGLPNEFASASASALDPKVILTEARALRSREVAAQERELLAPQTAFQLGSAPAAPVGDAPVVEYHNYAQRMTHLDELLVRAQQAGFPIDRSGMEVSIRGSVMKDWPAGWTDPEVALDVEAQQAAGDMLPTARQIEFKLRLPFASPEDAARFAQWLRENARTPSDADPAPATPISGSWEVPDLRVYGLSPEELKSFGLKEWMKRVLLTARQVGPQEVSNLARQEATGLGPGRSVAVPRSLAKYVS